jgi:hypothetical protein
MDIPNGLRLDIARRTAAHYFGLGLDESYLKLLDIHEHDQVPVVKLLRAVLAAIEGACRAEALADLAASDQDLWA